MTTLYFPQLITGGVAQFPSRKRLVHRTIRNVTPGSSVVKMAEPEGVSRIWELAYAGLTDDEIGRLSDLFEACEGRLRLFVFLDPFGNLLRWTESLADSVWQGSLQVTSDVAGPDGQSGAWRLTNGAQASQAMSQTVDGPGWYRYSFSVWARSESADRVTLRLANADGAIDAVRAISPEWEHVSVSGEISGSSDEIRCSIELPAACAVDVFGPQLEAQNDASGYRKNTDTNRVFMARFDHDEFECVTHGPNNHSTRIRVVSVPEGE